MEVHGALTDAQRDAVLRIQRSGHHLLGLINDVLNYAKLEAGRVEYRRERMDVHDAVGATLPLIGPQASAKRIAVEHTGCDRWVVALADQDKVQQVVLNLLSNAVRHTPPGGRVMVRCEAHRSRAWVRVRDTGPGIPADRLEEIFEPFVQLGRSLSSAREGTGLGLAISRDLARAMAGELTVSSAAGEGSEFVLELPADEESAGA
jgi:signal transduction histidine kinase